jgi:hypothetical protein
MDSGEETDTSRRETAHAAWDQPRESHSRERAREEGTGSKTGSLERFLERLPRDKRDLGNPNKRNVRYSQVFLNRVMNGKQESRGTRRNKEIRGDPIKPEGENRAKRARKGQNLTWRQEEEGEIVCVNFTQAEVEHALWTEDTEETMKGILDTGCTLTVCGENWLIRYLEMISNKRDFNLARDLDGQGRKFAFGASGPVKSKGNIKIPMWTLSGLRYMRVEVMGHDTEQADLPLLISKEEMRDRLGMNIFMDKHHAEVLGEWTYIGGEGKRHYSMDMLEGEESAHLVWEGRPAEWEEDLIFEAMIAEAVANAATECVQLLEDLEQDGKVNTAATEKKNGRK